MRTRAVWQAAPRQPAEGLLGAAGFSPRLARLLAHRGLDTPEAAGAFLAPSVDQLHDPFLLFGLEQAVGRLVAAREAGERVAVVGDYDVDGVTATALLLVVFEACGIDARPVLPHRLREGYGFQPLHVERARELGCKVIVTVDCGTSAAEAIAAAGESGVDVIVTDHHLPGEALPAGAVIVNPRQPGCAYPFPYLAGVGLALKLAQGLAARLDRALPLDPLLRVACLGTIADLVPLVGENRVIASRGLATFGETRSVGLKALMDKAGVKPPLSASDVGFRLGPRLNAAGRLASPDQALELLLARDREQAQGLADQLESANRSRQEEEGRAVLEAGEDVRARSPRPSILVAWSEGWHRGVVGIAAGRLARELSRPTILLSVEGEVATGSGRSLPGLDLHSLVRRSAGRCRRFGGHPQAIGLTVETAELEELRQELEQAAAAEWPAESLVQRFEYEIELAAGEVTEGLTQEIVRLEPFGIGNPQPLLRLSGLRLRANPRLFGTSHLSAVAEGHDGGRVNLLGWRWQERAADLDGAFEVLGYLERDSLRGEPVIRLADARPMEA
ncbi:MAG TPA: single-stranded-DNA-specific exonuclease RecJ [Thermoanaerobaculia bacterium]|nr:single-stranded-DNA-specific exonuclease RecJ [Thermoanaerobaculia bacterium]